MIAAEKLSYSELLAEVEQLRRASEKMAARECEKSVLLSISEAIATIRDKNELWAVMMNKVQPLLGFKASVSTIYSADYSQHCYILFSGVFAENLVRELKSRFNVYFDIFL